MVKTTQLKIRTLLTDEEKTRLRDLQVTERFINDYEANIVRFVNCLLRLQPSADPIEGLQIKHILRRFETFTETCYESPDASLQALDEILWDTLRHLLASEGAVLPYEDEQDGLAITRILQDHSTHPRH